MPTLNVYHPIDYIDPFDTTVTQLVQGHPVFLLAAEDGSKLVIKQEHALDAGKALSHNLEVMAMVSPTTDGSRVLLPKEVDALHYVVKSSEVLAPLLRRVEQEGIVQLRLCLLAPNPWFKMPAAERLMSLEEASAQLRAQANKHGVRAIAKSLNANGGFERLGEIVAVDLYNHNLDRFDWSHLCGKKSRGLRYPWSTNKYDRFLTIANVGNVLVALEAGETKPVGLDSYDPRSLFRSPDTPVEKVEKGLCVDQPPWGGRLLAITEGARQRKAFAKDILADLNVTLGERDRSFCMFSKKRLDDDGDKRIVKGMEKATTLLIQMLQAKCSATNAPPGLASRLEILRK
jgi:hypothetical protein